MKIGPCPQCPESDGWPSKRRPSRWATTGHAMLPLLNLALPATLPCRMGNYMAKFDSILGTVGNTPTVRINNLTPRNDVNLFVKIEAFNPLGSVKDRLALGVIEAAEEAGQLRRGQTVIEATSGNTGIGLAM